MEVNLSIDTYNTEEIEEIIRDIHKGLNNLNVCDVDYNSNNLDSQEGAKGINFEILELILTTASTVALEEVIRYLITKARRNKRDYSIDLNLGGKIVKITGEKDDVREILDAMIPNNE